MLNTRLLTTQAQYKYTRLETAGPKPNQSVGSYIKEQTAIHAEDLIAYHNGRILDPLMPLKAQGFTPQSILLVMVNLEVEHLDQVNSLSYR